MDVSRVKMTINVCESVHNALRERADKLAKQTGCFVPLNNVVNAILNKEFASNGTEKTNGTATKNDSNVENQHPKK